MPKSGKANSVGPIKRDMSRKIQNLKFNHQTIFQQLLDMKSDKELIEIQNT